MFMDSINMKNKNIILIMVIALILVLVGGGTMAWLSWRSANNTVVSFTVTGGVLTIDGGGNITGYNMAPTDQCNHENYAIKRTITAQAVNGTDNNMKAYIQLYTKDTLFPNVYKMENLEWVISSSDSDCITSSNILASGNFSNIDNSSDTSNKENTPLDLISFSVPAGETINKTYYLYIWVNEDYAIENVGDTVTQSIQGISFTLQVTGKITNDPYYRELLLNGADPVLESGMIPITLSADGVATTADISNEWYNYGNKEWANAVLVNSSSRSTYINNDGTINSGVTVPESNILAYYVWIPRYKYAFPNANGNPETISIVFENKDTSKSTGTARVTSYYTHPAFTFRYKELNGIWVGKFETGGDETTPKIIPNVQSLRSQDINAQFTTSLKFAGGTMRSSGAVSFSGSSKYGLTKNTDSHKMKNSEWGAVAYLSHSQYGLNADVYVNNSSQFYTGRSSGSVGSNRSYSPYGRYTWTGQSVATSGTIGSYVSDRTLGTKASTTGNVTGIYDMAGGTYESVMSFYGERTDGDPTREYFDSYSVTSGDLCTLRECGGHALNETAGWYGETDWFVDGEYTWYFLRSGGYIVEQEIGYPESDGLFIFEGYDGAEYVDVSWRSVLVDGTY